MIDSAILRSDPDRIRESQRRRGEDVSIVDRLIEADKHSREARQRFDELRNEQKVLSKQIGPLQGQLKKADDDAKPGLQSDVDALMARAQDPKVGWKMHCRLREHMLAAAARLDAGEGNEPGPAFLPREREVRMDLAVEEEVG